MVYAPEGSAERVQTLEVPEADGGASAWTMPSSLSRARRCSSKNAYQRQMDIEWARDGESSAPLHPASAPRDRAEPCPAHHPPRYTLERRGQVLQRRRSIGRRIGAGTTWVITRREMARVRRRCPHRRYHHPDSGAR